MNQHKLKILVTGGAGFIGSNLVEALMADSRVERVRVLDNFSNGKKTNISRWLNDPRFQLMEGDIRDYAVCLEACKDIDAISHQAALGSVPRSVKDPLSTHEVNATGTLNIFTAARETGVKQIVYASSSSVYGDNEKLPKQEHSIGNPLSPYALSKSIDEQYAAVYARNYGMSFIGLRYFNVFGPKQDPEGPYAAVVPLFLKALVSGSVPKIFGDGEQSRDFTYVSNAVKANMLGLFHDPRAGSAEAYNIACGFRTTVNELWKALSSMAGVEQDPSYLPERSGDIRHSLADISKAQKDLGFQPDTAFSEGLKKTYDWFVNEYKHKMA